MQTGQNGKRYSFLMASLSLFQIKELKVRIKIHLSSRIPWVFNFCFYKKAGRVEIAIVGDKLFASTGKTSVFEKTEVTCQEAHGSIAAPRNLNENKAIQKIVQYYNSYAYLGIMESDEPGKFHFRNGDPLNFTNWYKNEPSSQGVEKCVEMYNDGTWNDKMCNNYRLEVCEF
uniref:C-type lectin domain-containing protein n=1 Tax=Naja naja TaxID=35670 RepID=A0A8C6VPK9_NAJNA